MGIINLAGLDFGGTLVPTRPTFSLGMMVGVGVGVLVFEDVAVLAEQLLS